MKEAVDGCTAIVKDAFLGEDINNLKMDFPDGVAYKDIKISFQALRLNIEHSNITTPSIEVVVSMQDSFNNDIGYYLIVYDDELSRVDEYFVIE